MNIYREFPVRDGLHLLSLFTASRRRFGHYYEFQGESHDFYEFVCIKEGRAGITAGKEVTVLSAGQCLVHPPNEFHKIWSDGVEADVIIFSFRAEAFPELSARTYSLSPEELMQADALFEEADKTFVLIDNNVTALRGSETDGSVFLKKLELFLLNVFSREGAKPRYRSRSADNYIRILSEMEKRLNEFPAVEEFADACRMSVPALEKTVHRYAGHGAMKHFSIMKMKRAGELLETGMNVKETAYTLGFCDPNYFSAVFKKHTGASPTRWKK